MAAAPEEERSRLGRGRRADHGAQVGSGKVGLDLRKVSSGMLAWRTQHSRRREIKLDKKRRELLLYINTILF
ncbi:hypothetical protein E2562_011876 [Oryza meyeriana var. granulata]|uniref:Uncharacterized protein n=1 Tax=Oryza meyeriana var. granulata TaxID=110450 RepID=A0A6G1CFG6_9ORYZ|nr:hypothetical protein E2562_011876 [Oryza meyeriana var. granulata]